MANYVYGFKEVAFAKLQADGTPSEALDTIGNIFKGGVTVTTEEPQVTKFQNEDGETIGETSVKGATTLEFSISDLNEKNLTQFLGGTKKDNELCFDDMTYELEGTLKITSQQDCSFTYNRVKMTVMIKNGFSGENPMLLGVKAVVLNPQKEGVKKIIFTSPYIKPIEK